MSYENKSLRCHNCKFWWPVGDTRDGKDEHLREHAVRGQCRRHPPPVVAAGQEWAFTQREDWCGEHSHVMS
jgi:hypothetical protein